MYVYTVKKNIEPLVVASKETGLEANAEKTKYCIWSRLEIRIQDKITTQR
jgi:hypothetical protein